MRESNELTKLQQYIQDHSEKFILASWCSPESLDLTLEQVSQLLACVQAKLPAHLADASKLILAFQATLESDNTGCKQASIQIYTQFSATPILHCIAQISDNEISVENINIRALAEIRKFSLTGHDHPIIIIVDDDLLLVKMLSRWITLNSSQEFEILCANNGDEALRLYHANYHCACIFMDIQMPEPHIDGLEATRKIRQFEKFHHLKKTPIFLMSAGKLEKEVIVQYEVQAFCQKPLRKDFCLDTLKNIMDKYHFDDYSDSSTYSM